MSTHGMGLDIAAVAAALEINSFALVGNSVQSPVAIEYAATHPEVSHLILGEAFAAVATSFLGPALHTQMAMAKIERESGPVFTEWERVVRSTRRSIWFGRQAY